MSEVKLHLGCGKRFLSGFIHIDLANYKHIDYEGDIKSLPMFSDSTVDLIYASHVLEYFDLDEAINVLKEWHRILKKGGILRLAVPDFGALASAYMIYGNVDRIRGPLYGKWKIPGRWEISSADKIVYHKTVYDFFSLTDALCKAGFINIRRWDWRKVFIDEHKGFDDFSQAYIPHMDKENGILISLNIEAEK